MTNKGILFIVFKLKGQTAMQVRLDRESCLYFREINFRLSNVVEVVGVQVQSDVSDDFSDFAIVESSGLQIAEVAIVHFCAACDHDANEAQGCVVFRIF